MNIKDLCDQIVKSYEEADKTGPYRNKAVELVHQLNRDLRLMDLTNETLIPILETTKKIALTRGNSKHFLEDNLLSLVSRIPISLWAEDYEENNQYLERSTESKEGQMAESLISFAKDIYEIKVSRDSFAGKRRGFALQIMSFVSNYFDVPELMELCAKSVKSKSKPEFLDCITCLEDYCRDKSEVPSKEIIKLIDARIKKTKHRVEATAGLNLQVETGLICEFEALSRLGDWKEKNGL